MKNKFKKKNYKKKITRKERGKGCLSFSSSQIVTTLTLGSRSRQGLAKVRAKSELGSYISCSQECKRVRGNEPPHSQMNSHFGNFSSNGLPNFHRAIVGVKTHWIEKFFISLESSWNVNA